MSPNSPNEIHKTVIIELAGWWHTLGFPPEVFPKAELQPSTLSLSEKSWEASSTSVCPYNYRTKQHLPKIMCLVGMSLCGILMCVTEGGFFVSFLGVSCQKKQLILNSFFHVFLFSSVRGKAAGSFFLLLISFRSYHLWVYINSQLSRFSAARGCSASFSNIGITKV